MDCVIFVHPSLSVGFMFDQCRGHHYKILSVITTLDSSKINVPFIEENSDFIFQGSKEPENDIKALKKLIAENGLNIIAVVNGIDSGIYYTDFIQKEILGYPIDLTAAKIRLNKYQVNERLAQHNLIHIPGVEIDSKQMLAEKLPLIQSLGLPIIAKPSEDTAAMSAFEIIHNLNDLNNYLDTYLGKRNAYYTDNVIKKIILQKYIPTEDFDEYVLDFVSFKGQHYCSGILYYYKEAKVVDGQLYEYNRYYTPYTLNELPEIAPLIEYVKNCLTALNVTYGFTHNELFWDNDNQFYLIESNNRMAGNGIIEIYQNAYGHNPLSDYFKLFSGKTVDNSPLSRKAYSLVIDIYNTSLDNATGINTTDIQSFEKIIHFRRKTRTEVDFYKNFTRSEKTNAALMLSNASKEQLQKDIDTILAREADGTLFLE